MIVLDTTVLLYAIGTEHPLRQPCRRLLSAPRELGLTTTGAVIQEFVTRRRPRADAVELGRSYFTLLRPLVAVPDSAVEEALLLLGAHPRLGAFDAVLVAAARQAGCTAVVTADRAFGEIDDLPVVFPDDAGVAGLVPALREPAPRQRSAPPEGR